LTILVTNDDGIQAPALTALREVLADLGRVIIVAPDRDQSTTSHALTLWKPFRIEKPEPDVYAVEGTPTDCVVVATQGLLEEPPTIVVSGINHGPNMGDDVFYSGTVAAAIEGALQGLPAIAISMSVARDERPDFSVAARFTRRVVDEVIARGIPAKTALNVNVPNLRSGTYKGVKITKLGTRIYQDRLIEKTDPRGRSYYWIGGDEPIWKEEEGTDFHAVSNGYASVTPLKLDLTDYREMVEMKRWELTP